MERDKVLDFLLPVFKILNAVKRLAVCLPFECFQATTESTTFPRCLVAANLLYLENRITNISDTFPVQPLVGKRSILTATKSVVDSVRDKPAQKG